MQNKDVVKSITDEIQSLKELCLDMQGQHEMAIREVDNKVSECINYVSKINNILNEIKNMEVDLQIRITDIQDIIHDIQVRVHDSQDVVYDVKTRVHEGQDVVHDVQTRVQEGQDVVHDVQTRVQEGQDVMHDVQTRINDIQDRIYDLINVNNIISNIQKSENDSNIRIKDIQNQVYNSSFQDETFDKQNKLLLWSIYKGENQTFDEAKKQFFMELPKEKGIMEIKQKLTFKLLAEFDKVCRRENITYWLDFGTMLGAIRQSGFSPWDDDIDLGMMRQDVKKLKAALEENQDIELWDMYAIGNINTCKLYRVMYRKYDCPCFVDIFVHDFCDKAGEETWSLYLKKRKEIRARTIKFKNKPDEITEYSTNPDRAARNTVVDPKRIKQIDQEFDKVVSELKDKIGWSEEKRDIIIWGIDNFTLKKGERMFKHEMIFPLRETDFEGGMFFIPNQAEKILFDRYGDIYTMPQDMISHEHLQLTEKQKENLLDVFEKECVKL